MSLKASHAGNLKSAIFLLVKINLPISVLAAKTYVFLKQNLCVKILNKRQSVDNQRYICTLKIIKFIETRNKKI